LTAELMLTSKHSAASRRDALFSTASITRSRKSDEQALGMALSCEPNHFKTCLEDSILLRLVENAQRGRHVGRVLSWPC
jgi:hypothetical protein